MNKKMIIPISFVLGLGIVGISSIGAIDYTVKRAYREKNNLDQYVSKDDLIWISQQHFEDLEIKSWDGLLLKAKLLKANNHSDKVIIAIHGYRMNNLKEYGKYLQFYHRLGFHILLPDNRAHGQSEGKYIGFGWLDRLDCLQWIDEIKKYFHHPLQIVLHGISMGSATVLMASGEKLPSDVKCIIADCGYSSMIEEVQHVVRQTPFPNFIVKPAAWLSQYRAGYSFYDASTMKQVKKSQTPTLFIHGDKYDFVPTFMVYDLYNACPCQKQLLIIKNAKHAQSYTTDPVRYQKTVISFIQQFIK